MRMSQAEKDQLVASIGFYRLISDAQNPPVQVLVDAIAQWDAFISQIIVVG